MLTSVCRTEFAFTEACSTANESIIDQSGLDFGRLVDAAIQWVSASFSVAF
jgi:hypothetical protein